MNEITIFPDGIASIGGALKNVRGLRKILDVAGIKPVRTFNKNSGELGWEVAGACSVYDMAVIHRHYDEYIAAEQKATASTCILVASMRNRQGKWILYDKDVTEHMAIFKKMGK